MTTNQITRHGAETQLELALHAAEKALVAAMDALDLARNSAHQAALVGTEDERRTSRIVRSALIAAHSSVRSAWEVVL